MVVLSGGVEEVGGEKTPSDAEGELLLSYEDPESVDLRSMSVGRASGCGLLFFRRRLRSRSL